jgi:hypothetical protein
LCPKPTGACLGSYSACPRCLFDILLVFIGTLEHRETAGQKIRVIASDIKSVLNFSQTWHRYHLRWLQIRVMSWICVIERLDRAPGAIAHAPGVCLTSCYFFIGTLEHRETAGQKIRFISSGIESVLNFSQKKKSATWAHFGPFFWARS